MINQAALSAIDIEKPAGAPKEGATSGIPSAPPVDRKGKTIVPISDGVENNAVGVSENQGEPVSITSVVDATPDAQDGDKATPTVAKEPAATEASSTPKQATKAKEADAKLKLNVPTPSFNAAPAKTSETSSLRAIGDESQMDEGNLEAKEKTAEEKRQEELEAMVAAGTYHVPIGQVTKRRSIVIFLVILVTVLLLVAADLALDMELVTISGLPHTNFLR